MLRRAVLKKSLGQDYKPIFRMFNEQFRFFTKSTRKLENKFEEILEEDETYSRVRRYYKERILPRWILDLSRDEDVQDYYDMNRQALNAYFVFYGTDEFGGPYGFLTISEKVRIEKKYGNEKNVPKLYFVSKKIDFSTYLDFIQEMSENINSKLKKSFEIFEKEFRNQFFSNSENISELMSEFELTAIKNETTSAYDDCTVACSSTQSSTIPRKKITSKEVVKRFENLRKLEPEFEDIPFSVKNLPRGLDLTYRGEYKIILYDSSEYLDLNLISDKWVEPIRLEVSVGGNPSPEDFFIKNRDQVEKYSRENYGDLSEESLRESLYKLSLEATTFKPSTAVMLYKYFDAMKVLDFSSGWGDRLIAAMACDLELYVGVDPNSKLHPKYQDMIKFFGKHFQLHGEYKMVESPFEEWDPPKKYRNFDMVFTSPPYFDYEIYSEDESQSVHNRDLNQWFNEFLMVSIKKSLKLLKKGGILAININDIRDGPRYVLRMLAETKKIATYLGCMGYSGKTHNGQPRNPQPIWIFKKGLDSNPEIIVLPEELPHKTINVVRDDLFAGGTKSRGLIEYMKMSPAKEFVYLTPTTGSAQLALAYSAKVTGKKVTLFMSKLNKRTPLTNRALSYGNVKLIEKPGDFKILGPMAEKYTQNVKREKGDDYVELLPLGFNNEQFLEIMASQIVKALPKRLKKYPPKRIWVAAGSGLLANVLYRVFPDSKILLVQVGKTIWPDMYDQSRSKLYVSEESFYTWAKEQPPYPTTKSYDAKVWTFVKRFGKDGDYVWNVTSDF